MPFAIIRQDITKMHVDAIVNAANTRLAMGGGVCGAIFQAAGAFSLQNACKKVAPIKTGSAAITPGFKLPARYVIHAVGPIYKSSDECMSECLLRSAYSESLALALKYNCKSIAFPLISSGIYGYPKEKALKVAVSAIGDFLSQQDMDIYLAIFDNSSFVLSGELLNDVDNYISENYNLSHQLPCLGPSDLARDSFHIALMHLIGAKNMTDAEVCRRANIHPILFSKIATVKDYIPSKCTALALAIALELNLDRTNSLIEKAGYVLSCSRKSDLIVMYFILNGRYDIFEINEVLFKYAQPLLGSI